MSDWGRDQNAGARALVRMEVELADPHKRIADLEAKLADAEQKAGDLLLTAHRYMDEATVIKRQLAAATAESADIRQRLRGYPDSRLDGEGGLAAAAMNRLDACEAENERLRAEIDARKGDPVTRLHNLCSAMERNEAEPLACGHRLANYCDHCETCGQCRDVGEGKYATGVVEKLRAEVDQLRAINERLREVRWRVIDWTHQYGAALCPGTRPDTFGEGMREAKEQVKRLAALADAPKEKSND